MTHLVVIVPQIVDLFRDVDTQQLANKTYAMFVNSIEVFNRNIDPGPEWPLETEGAENWASSTERQDGLEASKEEIDALRSDTITDSHSLMLDLIDSTVEILKNNGGDEEEIVKAFYASPPMSAKSAAKQSDPVLVKAAPADI